MRINEFKSGIISSLLVKCGIVFSFLWVLTNAQQEKVDPNPVFSGWLMVFLITALLVGIAWLAMNRRVSETGAGGDQILLDLNEKLKSGAISREEYDKRKKDLDL